MILRTFDNLNSLWNTPLSDLQYGNVHERLWNSHYLDKLNSLHVLLQLLAINEYKETNCNYQNCYNKEKKTGLVFLDEYLFLERCHGLFFLHSPLLSKCSQADGCSCTIQHSCYDLYYDYDYIMIMKPFWMNESVNHYVSSHALHDSIMSTNLLCWWVEHRPWTWHEWRYLVFWSYKLYPAACWVHWTDSGPQDLHPCRWPSFQTPIVGIISKLTIIQCMLPKIKTNTFTCSIMTWLNTSFSFLSCTSGWW